MFSNKNSFLAQEGWYLIAALLVLAVVGNYTFGTLSAVFCTLSAAVLTLIFREPVRDITSSPLALICPVGGTVSSVQPLAAAPLPDGPVTEIVISVGPVQGYALYSPTEGYIRELTVDRCSVKNGKQSARCMIWLLETDEKDSVVVSLAPTGVFNHVYCDVQPGERVRQGDSLGFFRFGGEVKVFIPDSARVAVTEGDKVTAGSDIIANLQHDPLPRRILD